MIISALGQSARLAGNVARISALAAGLFATVAFSQSADQSGGQTGKTAEFQDLSITVETGDTFSDIISRELNSLDAWGEIARYNKLESPDNLKPGDTIVIPAEILRLKNYATVVFVKGAARHHITANNSKVDLSKGDRIYSGDLIETLKDGFVSVAFNGGTSVNIQPDSTMKINILECVDRELACEINLESGKGQLGLDVQSVGFKKPTVFSINTPYASAAVRGTSFDFDINDGNVLGVTDGTVEISINGLRNDIGIGKGVLAGEGRSINDVFDLLKQPELMLRDDMNRISSEDMINWDAMNGAANYLIAYARSESMQDIHSTISLPGTFTKPELPPGEFFISGRAVASNGLRGFINTKKLVSVGVDEAAEPPTLDITVSENELSLTASGSSDDNVEVKIGNAMETIDATEFIVASQVVFMKGGETRTFEIDSTRDLYLQSRKVLDAETVSPYGLLYFIEKTGG